MGYLEKYRIFVPELRRSLHKANAQLLDFQSKSNLERVTALDIAETQLIFCKDNELFV